MFNREFKTSFYKEDFPTFDPVLEKTGKVSVITYKKRTEDLNKGLSFSDFSLQSLIDADAADLLNPISPIQRDSLTVADTASSVVDYIGSNLDNVSVEPVKEDVTNE